MRKSGFYKVVFPDGEVTAGEYDDVLGVWNVIGSDECLSDEDFLKIGRFLMDLEGGTGRKVDPVKRRDAARRYREANREKIREKDRAYREQNQDKLRAYRKGYMQKYRDKTK